MKMKFHALKLVLDHWSFVSYEDSINKNANRNERTKEMVGVLEDKTSLSTSLIAQLARLSRLGGKFCQFS